jgi:hypothetical protein
LGSFLHAEHGYSRFQGALGNQIPDRVAWLVAIPQAGQFL